MKMIRATRHVHLSLSLASARMMWRRFRREEIRIRGCMLYLPYTSPVLYQICCVLWGHTCAKAEVIGDTELRSVNDHRRPRRSCEGARRTDESPSVTGEVGFFGKLARVSCTCIIRDQFCDEKKKTRRFTCSTASGWVSRQYRVNG
jgi:hypothetical protein